ncbi:CheY-specific phosphatase CheX [Silvibacterium bohemicum]|uniref:CheY-specific phosphatase CheX n=1 Tax=Silvibacterium bohemicum TaxID=1577686 RepID=A0A841K0A9_9BACT|nr:chemotaxis protein CheX [Silvibacterium bohemicum]MBB6147032.1 CheY-specific phosphatase CheX [Silvibacterium bohemicum]
MQPAQFEPLLQDAVNEVLESMCFLSSEDSSANIHHPETEPWVGRRLDFRGPYQGCFGVRTSLNTARLIASNFLGEEPAEITDEQAEEVVGEVANMVCGTLLASVETHHTFDLTSPRLDDGKAPASLNRIARTFTLEEGELQIWLET